MKVLNRVYNAMIHNRMMLEATGATAMEWALMVSLIAVVIIGAVALFGQRVVELFERFPALS